MNPPKKYLPQLLIVAVAPVSSHLGLKALQPILLVWFFFVYLSFWIFLFPFSFLFSGLKTLDKNKLRK